MNEPSDFYMVNGKQMTKEKIEARAINEAEIDHIYRTAYDRRRLELEQGIEPIRKVKAITGITCENGETHLEYEWVPVATMEKETKCQQA